MLSTNRSEQLPVDDDVKGTVNVEPNDKNLNKNLKRTRAKESQVSEADWNLNNCNRLNNCNWPTTITNSPNYMIKPKRPTTLMNGRPENQDIPERKLHLADKTSVNRKKNKKNNK